MKRLQYDASTNTILHLDTAQNDAMIRGWDKDTIELVLDGEPEQCTVRQENQTLSIESDIALSINVPHSMNVQVGTVNGDLILRDLSGSVSVQSVDGETLVQGGNGPISIAETNADLTVERLNGPLSATTVHADVRLSEITAPIVLDAVHGDVRGRSIGSTLDIGTVSGDVRLRDAAGTISLKEGHSDFKGDDLHGGMNIQLVKGDMLLKTAVTPGLTYRGQAGGDLVARFPPDTSAHFVLEARGALVAKLPNVIEQETGRLVGEAGGGEAQIELSARGDLSVKIQGQGSATPFDFDFGADIAAQVESQISESLGTIDFDSIAQQEIEKAVRKAEHEIEKARHRIEQERHNTEERLRRAQERAARAARRAQERIVRRSRQWSPPFGFADDPGTSKPQVSEEEQLAILKMVQAGTISVKEAEKLLKALES